MFSDPIQAAKPRLSDTSRWCFGCWILPTLGWWRLYCGSWKQLQVFIRPYLIHCTFQASHCVLRTAQCTQRTAQCTSKLPTVVHAYEQLVKGSGNLPCILSAGEHWISAIAPPPYLHLVIYFTEAFQNKNLHVPMMQHNTSKIFQLIHLIHSFFTPSCDHHVAIKILQ